METAAARVGRQSPLRVVLVYLRRAVALFAVTVLLAALYVAVTPLLPAKWIPWEEETAATVVAPPPPKPAGVPYRIPLWAWELHEWHSASGAQRGERPRTAPRIPPPWYWKWREWRVAVER